MDKITFEMSFEGYVAGGIDCRSRNTKGEIMDEKTVTDLPQWIKTQFLELRKTLKRQKDTKAPKAFCYIYIGDVIYPFATLVVTKSKYWAIYDHKECRGGYPAETTTPDDISFNIALKASQVSDLNLKW